MLNSINCMFTSLMIIPMDYPTDRPTDHGRIAAQKTVEVIDSGSPIILSCQQDNCLRTRRKDLGIHSAILVNKHQPNDPNKYILQHDFELC